MEVAKTFERQGVRYHPGDQLPPDLDKPALEHYLRHGMVRELRPNETKPMAHARKSRTLQPSKQTDTPAAPSETKDAVDSNPGASEPAADTAETAPGQPLADGIADDQSSIV